MENCMDIENNSDSDYEDNIEECQTDLEEDEFDEIIPLKDDAKLVLKGHTSVVLSVTCDSASSIIFTGGMDDKIIVWSMETGEQLCVLGGHSDSVTHLSMNGSDSLLASGDLHGLVNVWKISKSPFAIRKLKAIELSEIIDLKWTFSSVTNEESLFVCDITGTVQSFTTDSITADEASLEMSPSFYSQGKGCCCNGFGIILDGQYASVLYGGTCGLHDECGNTNELALCDLHTYNTVKVDLKCVANEEEDNDEGLGAGFATGRWNNSELLAIGDWSQLIVASVVRVGASVSCKLHKVAIKDGGLVTNVAFSDVLPYIAFATKLGVIGVYDVSHSRLRHVWQYETAAGGAPQPQLPTVANGGLPHDDELADDNCGEAPMTVSQLRWQPDKSVFFTTGLDGRLCCWDARVSPSGDVPSWWGHSGIVWDLCVAPGGRRVITVSEDTTARVFQI